MGEVLIKLVFALTFFIATAAAAKVRLQRSVFIDATKPTHEVFYVFGGDGISIIDPVQKNVVKKIPHDMKVQGSGDILCTRSARLSTNCSWAGAAIVQNKYIFVADSSGNRLIIIDVDKQLPVKAMKTHGYPYQVTYLAALDEVWVLCWSNSTLDVVGEKGGLTSIGKVKNASSLMILHSIKAQDKESYKYIMHGFFRAENCQNQDRSLKYGVSSHYNEQGIHKINLIDKKYEKFINTTSSGCKATFGLAYSFVKKYAFVHCLGDIENSMVVVDVDKDRVVHANDSITDKATGHPYSSPDGKYILVLNSDRIIPYYMEHSSKDVRRLNDIIISNGFWPSKVAFVKIEDGFTAYITSKNTSKLMIVTLHKHHAMPSGYIDGVGAAAIVTREEIKKTEPRYAAYYRGLMQRKNMTFVQANFERYVTAMYMEHITRRIATGCGLKDRYVASPSGVEHKIAIIDGEKKVLVDMIDGGKHPRTIVWVGKPATKSANGSATRPANGSVSQLMISISLLLVSMIGW